MKKSWVFVFLIIGILSMTNLVLALHFCQGEPADTSIHGVEIDGECFNCGVDDGICPTDFGVSEANCPGEETDCGAGPTPEQNAYWSLSATNPTPITNNYIKIDRDVGKTLYMIVENTGLANNDPVTFKVYEDDGATGDDILNESKIGYVSNGRAVGNYTVRNIGDVNGEAGATPAQDPEPGDVYELRFRSGEGTSWMTASDPEVVVNLSIEAAAILSCSDYDDNITCAANTYHVGFSEGELSDYQGECQRRQDGVGCLWTGTVCGQNTSYYYPDTNPTNCDETQVSCSYTEAQKTGNECKSDDFFKVSYTSSNPIECPAWTSQPIPCPQQLKLPFFGIVEFFISLCMISLIYMILIKKETL